MATPRAAEHRDLEQRLRNIESTLRTLAGQVARRPQFTIESGDLTIDGGDVLMLDDDGSVMFRLGAQEFGDRGLSIFRETGEPAFELKRDGASEFLQQTWRLSDTVGNVIVSEWAFGQGLARPRIPAPCHPATTPSGWGVDGPEASTTSGAFVTLFRSDLRRQNPLYTPGLSVKCSDGTTAAEVQVTNDAGGAALNDFFTGTAWTGVVPTGSTSFVNVAPALNMPGVYDARVKLNIQVRRTAGAGTVTIAVPLSTG
jgi:hypothetical protein